MESAAKRRTRSLRRLRDLTPDSKNANKHTERGSGLMEASIRECGFGDSITVDRFGNVISGNQRVETVADLKMDDPIVVRSDGTRPVIHQRIDLDINEPRARKLAVMQNRVGELNLDWDTAVLKEISAEVSLSPAFTEKELAHLFDTPVIPAEQESAETSGIKHECKCPYCGKEWDVKDHPGSVRLRTEDKA